MSQTGMIPKLMTLIVCNWLHILSICGVRRAIFDQFQQRMKDETVQEELKKVAVSMNVSSIDETCTSLTRLLQNAADKCC